MDLLIQVPEKEVPFFMELLKKLDFVKVKKADNSPVLDSLERSLSQMQDMRASKLPKPPIAELFANE